MKNHVQLKTQGDVGQHNFLTITTWVHISRREYTKPGELALVYGKMNFGHKI